MIIRAVRGFSHGSDHVRRGAVLDVTAHVGAALVAKGLAAEMVPAKEAGGEHPTGAPPQNGGQTGGDEPPSSSHQDHPPETQESKPAGDAPASLPSTVPGGSRRGRTSSTRVTSSGGKGSKAAKNSAA